MDLNQANIGITNVEGLQASHLALTGHDLTQERCEEIQAEAYETPEELFNDLEVRLMSAEELLQMIVECIEESEEDLADNPNGPC